MSSPNTSDLIRAISLVERTTRDAIDVINRIEDDDASACVHTLRLAAEMVGCLRRLVPSADVVTIHRAFGAPGDFGYETPLGEALARLYSAPADPTP